MKKLKLVGLLFGILAVFTGQVFCQNAPVITKVNTTPNKNIQIHWTSDTNLFYKIDAVDTLETTNPDGTLAWTNLYDDYPAQGTNTFWMDAGDYNRIHPKDTFTRFYRVAVEGTNTPDDLTISVISPTNGSVVSGNITVTVSQSGSNVLNAPLLYLDGQEMNPSADGSNFVINTCESWNGQHTLFAVAKSQSGLESRNTFGITYNRIPSPFVTLSFSNLISDFSFSHEFFQPSLGQTQNVSALFAANCDWTLQILDDDSNAVRTVTGSGTNMSFDWDGTGDGGTNIPDGDYVFHINATTNSDSPMSMMMSPSLSFIDDITELWAVPVNGGDAVPFKIYPAGFDTNNLYIFPASDSEMESAFESSDIDDGEETFSPDDSGATGGNQDSDKNGNKNALGTVGIAYQQYLNPNIMTHLPKSGWPLIDMAYVGMDGANGTASTLVGFPTIEGTKREADDFAKGMTQGKYFVAFEKADDEVTINDLKSTSQGGNSIFNSVNLGYLALHGNYGTIAESDNVKYTYLWVMNLAGNSANYLRLSDFDFGSAGTNGLKWMTLACCNLLYQPNYNSMKSANKMPINSNLHILLGSSTIFWSTPNLGFNYAYNLTWENQQIIAAWVNAGQLSYQENHKNITNTIVYAYSGWANCFADTLKVYQTPNTSGGLAYRTNVVFTYP
ncbi:MAG TPA: DUF6345 domain-containing protein [Verrucomicrobiae bacterium]|nr:DUF6345 domain-containing protein [Verrucomicrobiae bacterium]